MQQTFQSLAAVLFDTKVDMSVKRKSRAEIENAFAKLLSDNCIMKDARNDTRGQSATISEEEWNEIFGED